MFLLKRDHMFSTLTNDMEELCAGRETIQWLFLNVPQARVFPVTYDQI